MPVDDSRNVSDNTLVDVDMGEKSGQISKNLPHDRGLIWNGVRGKTDWMLPKKSPAIQQDHSIPMSPLTRLLRL
jgi:hypothetical protein